jgi:hypothetical protein
VCDFGTAFHRRNCGRQEVGIPILKELHHSPNIVLESFRKLLNILVRKQLLKVGRLGWITPKDFYFIATFQDAGDFIAGHNHRNLAGGTGNPLGNLSLCVGV